VLNWSDIPAEPDAAQVIAVVLNPDFGGGGSRIQEAFSLVVVALLIAVVMWRTRATLRRQLAAEREHASVVEMFGRFVPQAVVDSMISGRGALSPIEREATVLFADIADFTHLTERAGPARTVTILNEYFDAATRIVGERGGIVTQFQGDAILATFNVPVEDKAHAPHAFDAALAMLAHVREHAFGGEQLRIRIGLNTGLLVAGNVGGGGRQTYTVHGDTVNLAARLEALNKEHGSSLLMSERTAAALPHACLEEVGSLTVRGFAAPTRIYTVREANGIRASRNTPS
jgi:class 3 adenylate cyclase